MVHLSRRAIAFVFICTLVAGLLGSVATRPPATSALPPSNRLTFNGKPIYVNGTNVAWHNWARDIGWAYNGYDPVWFENFFTDMQANGVNVVRLWIHSSGEFTPNFDGSWNVTGVNANFWTEFDDLLTRAKNHNVAVMPCLWSFDMAKKTYPHGGAPVALLRDPAKLQTYIDNVLVPMVQRYKTHPAIFAWEIINEPEWMVEGEADPGVSQVVTWTELQRFIGLQAAAINANTTQYVTTGAAMWKYMSDRTGDGALNGNRYKDSALQAASGNPNATLDFYQVHYYDWQAPYFHVLNGRSPEYYMADKPVLIGEYPFNTAYGHPAFLNDSYSAGYVGHMGWAYNDQCCGAWSNVSASYKAFRDAHASEINLNLSGGVQPTATRTATLSGPTRTPTINIGTPTRTRTRTATLSGPTRTRTRTATQGGTLPTATRTRTATQGGTLPTATRTRTATQGSGGTCSPATAITAPFTRDGSGTACWQIATIPSYINSWNLNSLTINGVSFTNMYATPSQLPPKINGYWYISYNSSVAWGHFEAR